jgi:hypothetical protein
LISSGKSGDYTNCRMNLEKQLPRKWAIVLALAVVYLPYVWLLLFNFVWNSSLWSWIKLSPILPGMTPAFLLKLSSFKSLGGWLFFAVMLLITLMFVSGMLFAAIRFRRLISLPILLLGLLFSCFCAWGAYGLARS